MKAKGRPAPGVVTLTTDFGSLDPYVGIMKGVILGIAPRCTIVDLTHHVPPQNVAYAAFCLASAVSFFPEGTVHLAVVDPGVGGARRAIAAATKRALYVAPDNGVLALALQRDPPLKVVSLDRPEFWLPAVSATFHGRDIFAPVAAALVNGAAVEELGTPIDAPLTWTQPEPVMTPDGALRGRVLFIDHFGNCITNVRRAALPWQPAETRVRTVDRAIGPIRGNYGEADRGVPLALFGSCGHLEIAVRDGSASRDLGLAIGDEVFLTGRADGD